MKQDLQPVTNIEMDYRVLSALEADPSMSQRAIARQLDVSLGKVNYCLKALINAGMVKAGNFQQSSNKTAYAYLLTSKGIKQKTKTTRAFLKRKIAEYDEIETEIKSLKEALAAERVAR